MATLRSRSGTELTDDVLEALADEAERGYDLSNAQRVYVGRPPLGEAGPSPRVQVRVDPKLAKALKARARREKRSVSEITRTALDEYLQRTR
jgi:CRISPR-associated endonuclease/helicase Cas3